MPPPGVTPPADPTTSLLPPLGQPQTRRKLVGGGYLINIPMA